MLEITFAIFLTVILTLTLTVLVGMSRGWRGFTVASKRHARTARAPRTSASVMWDSLACDGTRGFRGPSETSAITIAWSPARTRKIDAKFDHSEGSVWS